MHDRHETALHEAAHIVVGVHLGLKLRRASALPDPANGWDGYAWFPDAYGVAGDLMRAAGIYWDTATGHSALPDYQSADLAELRAQQYTGRDIATLTTAAGTILSTLRPAHTAVAAALMTHDKIGPRVISRIARGETD
jgi:hypothetical protein